MREVLRAFYTTLKSCDKYLFADRIADVAVHLKFSRAEVLARLKEYYDGFCFGGITRLYNPFSIL